MARANHWQLKALSEALLELHRRASLETLDEEFVRALRMVVPADRYSINYFEGENIVRAHSTPGFPKEASLEVFNAHIGEHPTIRLRAQMKAQNARSTWGGRWSDYISPRQFRRKALHRDFFRHIETNYQGGIVCLGQTDLGISCNRRAMDFTDEEMLLLQLLAPHLELAYQRATAGEKLCQMLALRDAALDGTVALVISETGTLLHCIGEAARLCAWYFPASSRESVPKPILRWLAAKGRSSRFTETRGDHQLVIECGEKVPVTSFNGAFAGRDEDIRNAYVLRMTERRLAPDAGPLLRLGLTPREAEVLLWIAEGKTNEEIAIILGARPNTVRKHVENIHRKLGVENRGTAAAMARELL